VRRYYVYILASRTGVLYVGMTNDLERRVWQHKEKTIPSFTAQYNVDRLVHYEECGKAWEAIRREKEIKGWLRAKKVALIEETNPEWLDLAADWYAADGPGQEPGAQLTRGCPPPPSSLSAAKDLDAHVRATFPPPHA
jgi:putative endonuclease